MDTIGLSDLAKQYRATLLDDVMPFWMRYGLGSADGALNNCIDDDGRLKSADRFMWSQGRALWVFSALYNRIEQRQEWLDVAHRVFGYLRNRGRNKHGDWVYHVDGEGNIVEGDTSIYVGGFVLAGLSEYFRATQNQDAAALALDTYDRSLARINAPGSYDIRPYHLPKGMRNLGVRMVFTLYFYELGHTLGRPDIISEAARLGDEILGFIDPTSGLGREFTLLDGNVDDSPLGRVCIPGHVIEGLWFYISTTLADRGDKTTIARCCELIRAHLEAGWDKEHGGVRLAVDATGAGPAAWEKADCKPMWAQMECLVATMLAHQHTGDQWCMEWHERIRNYAYSHYPTPAGDWTQWLGRDNAPIPPFVLPVKDPFHLPRCLMYLIKFAGEG